MSLQNLPGCLDAERTTTRHFVRLVAMLAACALLSGCGAKEPDDDANPVAQQSADTDMAPSATDTAAPATADPMPEPASSAPSDTAPTHQAGSDSHVPPWRRGNRASTTSGAEGVSNVQTLPSYQTQAQPQAQPAPQAAAVEQWQTQAQPYSTQAAPSPYGAPAAPASSPNTGATSNQSLGSNLTPSTNQGGWQGAVGELGRNLLGEAARAQSQPSGGNALRPDTLINRLLPGADVSPQASSGPAGQEGGAASMFPSSLLPGSMAPSSMMPSQLAPGSGSTGYAAQPSTTPVPLPATTANQPVEAQSYAASSAWPQSAPNMNQTAESAPQFAARSSVQDTQSFASPPPSQNAPAQTTSAPPVPATPPADVAPQEDYTTVKVFYGTDRARVDLNVTSWLDYLSLFYFAGGTLLAAGLFFVLSGLKVARSVTRPLAWFATAGTVLLAAWGGLNAVKLQQTATKPGVIYGRERGKLEVGVCEISIPPKHEVGELEAPTILRLEIREDPTKHVVLLGAYPQDQAEFYEQLRNRVSSSPKKDAFVFVHGFNVSFEDAARRTAQMAHDLKFEGAPIFYSWPSQAQLAAYTIDENNVEWTVPHLKEFLMDVAQQSGAESICLVAHSMGNRALTKALHALSFRMERPVFREVVLTAPDIDADVFRRDLAPQIVRTADRVTLYASSNDEALRVSKQIHGAPRAGDSGALLVVVPGIETIDVSGIDTSLLGHSYYGSNGTVLSDLIGLLKHGMPAAQRSWLLPRDYQGLPYWVFAAATASAGTSQPPQR